MNLSQPKENKVTLEVSQKEAQLIRLMREKYRFGRFIVVMHDGEPTKIEQTVYELIG